MNNVFTLERIREVEQANKFHVQEGLRQVSGDREVLQILFGVALQDYMHHFEYYMLTQRVPSETLNAQERESVIKREMTSLLFEAKIEQCDSIEMLARISSYSIRVLQQYPDYKFLKIYGNEEEWITLGDLANAMELLSSRNGQWVTILMDTFIQETLNIH
jgi:hypothetical protein